MKALDRLFDKLGYRPKGQGSRRRQWKGAGHSRLRTWADGLLSPDAELWHDLPTLRGRSRNLTRDNPHAAAAARVWVDNVIGPPGLTYHPLVMRGDESLDTETNGELRRWWRRWGARSVCTMDRRHSWHDVERLAARSEFVDGEFLAIERTGRGVNEFGYALQLIDPDQLDETYTQPATKSRNAIRMGVEVSEYGEPLVYHFWQDHPHDLIYGRRERIAVPAAMVLHYFDVLRPGQTRGVPKLAPVMSRLKLLDGYSEAELAAAVVGACNGIVYEQTEEADLDEEDGDPAGEIPEELEPAMSRLLPKGVRPHAVKVEHPTAAYGEFVGTELRATGAGTGIAYSTLTGDLRGVSYSGLRDGSLKERDVYRGEHVRIATHLHSRVFRAALKNSVFFGAVDLPSQDWRRYAMHAFAGRGWAWVDPWKDLKAAELELALRLNSRSAIALQGGRSFEEILQEIEQDQKLAEQWDIDLPDPKPTGAGKEPVIDEEEKTNAGNAADGNAD